MRPRATGRRWAWMVALVVLACVGRTYAHGLRPGVLALAEQEPGVFAVAWTEPVDTAGGSSTVVVSYPESCRRSGARLECGEGGLQGPVRISGLDSTSASVSVQVRWSDGRTTDALVTAEAPSLDLRTPPASTWTAWSRLGVRHVLGGFDHLAFVLGLLLVVGASGWKRLVGTLTAFTAAHSVTLGLSVMGVVTLPQAPVEATIAASVVLVAREASHRRPTLTRRAPWAVALLFGLVHGLGFAGVVTELGLPRAHTLAALVGFNVGVELGQLAAVTVLLVASALLSRILGSTRAASSRTVLTTALGGVGAWWLIERVVQMA